MVFGQFLACRYTAFTSSLGLSWEIYVVNDSQCFGKFDFNMGNLARLLHKLVKGPRPAGNLRKYKKK